MCVAARFVNATNVKIPLFLSKGTCHKVYDNCQKIFSAAARPLLLMALEQTVKNRINVKQAYYVHLFSRI